MSLSKAFGKYDDVSVAFDTKIDFEKTGEEIGEGIASRLAEIGGKILERQAQAKEICDRREIDVKEALAADDEEKFTALSSSNYSRAPQKNDVLKALEADLNALKDHVYAIKTHKAMQAHLNRVQANVDPKAEFQLSYDELVLFGF